MKIVRADGRTINVPKMTEDEEKSLDHLLLIQTDEMKLRGMAPHIPVDQQMAATSARLARERQAENGQPGPGYASERACAHCGHVFRSRSSRHRFCSVGCSGAWKKESERMPVREGVLAR